MLFSRVIIKMYINLIRDVTIPASVQDCFKIDK